MNFVQRPVHFRVPKLDCKDCKHSKMAATGTRKCKFVKWDKKEISCEFARSFDELCGVQAKYFSSKNLLNNNYPQDYLTIDEYY